ncbi:hypothetical protein PF010_g5138 [Phytophthora fragariae]|uniref:Uncharacterized protein n=1 Tax=Phytophthora fragariae TaxID=53985 RepID=A0A6G0LP93_9STRA|nr:hypothetical protein PF010_g5138 [Phytophthora fragariae]
MAGEDHNDEDTGFVLPSPHLFRLLWQLGHAVALVFFRGGTARKSGSFGRVSVILASKVAAFGTWDSSASTSTGVGEITGVVDGDAGGVGCWQSCVEASFIFILSSDPRLLARFRASHLRSRSASCF